MAIPRTPFLPILVGVCMTALSLGLHIAPVWVTMLNQGALTWDHQPLQHDYLVECIEEHRTVTAFAKRPLTSWAIGGLSTMGIAPEIGFILVGASFFLLAGLLVHRSGLWLGLTFDQALLAQVIFHASPTILFAWFSPMYTYDEPIQYVALLIAIGAWWHNRSWLFVLAFTTALIARETTVLIAPSLLYLATYSNEVRIRKTWISALIQLVLPMALYGIFLWHFHPSTGTVEDLLTEHSRIAYNFGNLRMTAESLWYLYLVLGLPLFLILRYRGTTSCTMGENRLIRAFLLAVVLNTLTVLFFAQAREARLFALPLILVWPLLGKALLTELVRSGGWRSGMAYLLQPARSVALIALLTVLYVVVRLTFPMSSGIQEDNPYHEYIAVQTLFMVACYMLPGRQVAQR